MATNYVEYIRTDGCQWFDTGVPLKDTTEVVMSVRRATQTVTSDAYYIWLGQKTTSDSQSGSTGLNIMVRQNPGLTNGQQVHFGGNSSNTSVTCSGLTTIGGEFHKLAIKAGTFAYDGTTTSLTSQDVKNDGYIFLLGGYPNGGRNMAADIQSVIITENDAVVAEFLPAVHNDVPCFHETVSDTFMYFEWRSGYDSTNHPLQAGVDVGPIEGYPYLGGSIQEGAIVSSGGTKTATLVYYNDATPSATWHLDTTNPVPQWLTISPASGGVGSTSVAFTAAANPANANRTYTATFTDGNGSTKSLSVSQMRNVTTYDYIEWTGTNDVNNNSTSQRIALTGSDKYIDFEYVSVKPSARGNSQRRIVYVNNFGLMIPGGTNSSPFHVYGYDGSGYSVKCGIGNHNYTGERVTVEHLVLERGGQISISGYPATRYTCNNSSNAPTVFFDYPGQGTRIGRITMRDDNHTITHEFVPARNENNAVSFYDTVTDTFHTPETDVDITPGNLPVSGPKTYTLDAIVSEGQDITLQSVTLERTTQGTTTQISPTYVSGAYNARRYTATDTVDGDASWEWTATDIYGNDGSDSVTTSVNGVPDRFWVKNVGQTDDYLKTTSSSYTRWFIYSTDQLNWTLGSTVPIPVNTKVYVMVPYLADLKSFMYVKANGNTSFTCGGDARTMFLGLMLGVVTTNIGWEYTNLFSGATSLTDAHELYFGVRNMQGQMLNYAFEGCTGLLYPPPFDDVYRIYAQNGVFTSCPFANPPSFSQLIAIDSARYFFHNNANLTKGIDFSHVGTVGTDNTYPLKQFNGGCSSVAEITTPRVAPVRISGGTTYTQWATGGIAASGNVMKSMPMTLTQNSTDGVPSGWTEVPYTYYAQVGTIDETARSLTFRWNGYLSNDYTQMRLRWTKTVDDAPIMETSLKIRQHGEYTVRGLEPDTEYFFMLDVMFQGQWRLMTGCVGTTLAISSDWPKIKNIGQSNGTITFENVIGAAYYISYRFNGSGNWTSLTVNGNSSATVTLPAGSYAEIKRTEGYGGERVKYTGEAAFYGNWWLLCGYINGLFEYNTGLIDASGMYFAESNGNLKTIVNGIEMEESFAGCTNMAYGPDLSYVTSVGDRGMRCMFNGCSSLLIVSDMPLLKTAGPSALSETYAGCISLRKGLNLSSVEALTDSYSFNGLYAGCSYLNEAWTPNVQTWDTDCFPDWLSNVSPTGTLHAPTGLVIPSGSSGIPSGWTRENY